MNIQEEIDTNKIMLQLFDEVEKHFKKQGINIVEHPFGALRQKIVEDVMALEMKSQPKEELEGISETQLFEKLMRNPQLLEMVKAFKEQG